MFHLSDILLLQPDERVKTIARAHVMTLMPSLALAFALIVVPFFLLFPLFELGIGGILLFAMLVVLGIAVACRKFLLWDANVCILTSLRVVKVDQRGLLTRIVSEAPLASIQDVSWSKRGFGDALFHMGSIAIQLAGGQTTFEARHIPHPDALHAALAGLMQEQKRARSMEQGTASPEKPAPLAKHQEDQMDRQQSTESEDRLNRITALLKTFSDTELARIETILLERGKSSSAPAP